MSLCYFYYYFPFFDHVYQYLYMYLFLTVLYVCDICKRERKMENNNKSNRGTAVSFEE
jgi:hypothetical protein